jgi:hypothetical protein
VYASAPVSSDGFTGWWERNVSPVLGQDYERERDRQFEEDRGHNLELALNYKEWLRMQQQSLRRHKQEKINWGESDPVSWNIFGLPYAVTNFIRSQVSDEAFLNTALSACWSFVPFPLGIAVSQVVNVRNILALIAQAQQFYDVPVHKRVDTHRFMWEIDQMERMSRAIDISNAKDKYTGPMDPESLARAGRDQLGRVVFNKFVDRESFEKMDSAFAKDIASSGVGPSSSTGDRTYVFGIGSGPPSAGGGHIRS